MKALCLIPAALSLACSVAFAQSPTEFTQSGQIKIESLTLNGEPQNFILGSSDASLRIPISDAFKIGVDLGVDAVQLDGQSGGYVFVTGVIASYPSASPALSCRKSLMCHPLVGQRCWMLSKGGLLANCCGS